MSNSALSETLFLREYLNTNKKISGNFLIYEEIQKWSGAKSRIRKGFLIDEEMRYHLPIYEEAGSHM